MSRRPSVGRSARVHLLVRLALALGLAGIPLALPAPASGVGPLPRCALDDVRTEPRGYDDWATTQVDWNLTLGRGYAPPDLVSVFDAGVGGGGLIRAVAFDDLRAMARAAADNGTPLSNISAYRGYRQQVALFRSYAGWTGTRFTNFDNAIKFSARPGHSEHQLGLTIDFVALGETGLSSDWEQTPTGAWMAENAWKFGWLMSYPKGKKRLTCYTYEPWHYRYVGRELARKIHDSGLTTREYLWANYTQVDGECMAAPPEDLETPGKARSCPLGTPAPSAPPGSSEAPPSTSPGSPVSSAPVGPSIDPTPGASPHAASPEATPGEPAGFAGDEVTAPVIAAAAIALLIAALLALRLGRRPRR